MCYPRALAMPSCSKIVMCTGGSGPACSDTCPWDWPVERGCKRSCRKKRQELQIKVSRAQSFCTFLSQNTPVNTAAMSSLRTYSYLKQSFASDGLSSISEIQLISFRSLWLDCLKSVCGQPILKDPKLFVTDMQGSVERSSPYNVLAN